MANTYTQIFIHLVFAVKYRRAIMPSDKVDRIFRYMSTVVNNTGRCRTIEIGGITDHVHLLVRLSPTENISKLVKSVKVATTGFINSEIFPQGGFAWQEGYGAFSVSASHTDAVAEYIRNQPQHHMKVQFLDEYMRILTRNKIGFDKEYLFKDLE